MADFTDEPWQPADDTRDDADELSTTSAREQDDPAEQALRDDDPAAQEQPGAGESVYPPPGGRFVGEGIPRAD